MSTFFTQAQIGVVLDLMSALEMIRDADEDCKKDGLPTLPHAPRKAIDEALGQAKKTLHPFTESGMHGYTSDRTERDVNVVKDAEWVLSFLQRLEFQGSMAPAETMGRVLAHLQQSEPAPSLLVPLSDDEKDNLIEAAMEEGANAACLHIQQSLGITDGGVAGLHFSGNQWKPEFKRTLKGYVEHEIDMLTNTIPW